MKRLVISISDANAASISNLVNSKKYENLNVAVDSLIAIALSNGQAAPLQLPPLGGVPEAPAEPINEPEPITDEPASADEPSPNGGAGGGSSLADIVGGAIKSAAKKRSDSFCKMPDGRIAICTYSDKSYFVAVTVEKNSPADQAILAKYGMKHQSTLPIVAEDGTENVWYGYCISAKKGGDINLVANFVRTIVGAQSVEMWPDQTAHSAKRKAERNAKTETADTTPAAPLSTKAEAQPKAPIVNDKPVSASEPSPSTGGVGGGLPMSVEKPIHMPIKTPSFVGTLCTCTPKQHKPKTVEGIEFFMLPRTPEDGSQGSYYYKQGGKCYMASYIGANGDKLYFLNWGECVPTTDKPVDCGGDFKHRDELIAIASIGLATAYVQGKVKSVQEWQIVAHETANNVNAGYLRKHCAA